MSTTVSYKGNTIATVDNNTKTLLTAGKLMEADVILTDSGGGASSWKLLGEHTYNVSTTSTNAAATGTIQCGAEAFTKAKMIYVRVRDTAGPRLGYFLGSDSFFINTNAANGSTSALGTAAKVILRYSTGGVYGIQTTNAASGYGVYGYQINSSGAVQIRQRYNSTYSLTINGTYKVEVYALDWPDSQNPFTV